MRLDVWSALPPAPCSVADYVAELLPELSRHAQIVCRTEEPLAVDPAISRAFALSETSRASTADLDLFHLGNSPSQGFVWRAARRIRGVLFLHEWSLGDMVRSETLGRGDLRAWRREARLGRGATGSYLARLVEEGRSGDLLPLAFPMNETLIRRARGVVTLSGLAAERVRATAPAVPLLALPRHVVSPPEVPDRRAARGVLGLPEERFLVSCPGLPKQGDRIAVAVAAIARLVSAGLDAALVVAEEDPEGIVGAFAREAGVASRVCVLGPLAKEDLHCALVAADVVVSLSFPSLAATPQAMMLALALGACVVLTAGSEAALDLPGETCVCVNPGPSEGEELAAVLLALARNAPWRSAIGAAAARRVAVHHSVAATVSRLSAFLGEVLETSPRSESSVRLNPRHLGPWSDLLEEAELAALEIGLDPSRLSLEAAVHSLVGGHP
jgi:glycosyltransferase involved in cell wall biosynthesis